MTANLNAPRPPPLAIRLVNEIGRLLESVHFSKPDLNAEHLIRHAQKRTGLKDWGDISFRDGLERLTLALQEEAGLSQIGRIAAYGNLLDNLCIRLRLIDYRARRPQVSEQKIERPLFILGLPRTGTTILYELIAQDPSFRSPASWEVARPMPPPATATYDNDKRIQAVDRMLALMEMLSPGFKSIHALGARLPQECVYMLASSFISEQFSYMYNIPDYRAWSLEQNMTPAYRWHASFLQHLQVDCAREHWVLKTPGHLAYLKYLLAQYPDATLVWTHRRPLDAVASFSSLTYTLRKGFSVGVDRFATGEAEFEHYSGVVRRGMEDRNALDKGQFVDVSFNKICADPIAVIDSIYAQRGLQLSTETEARMRDYLARHPRNLYGKHQYSFEQYGLQEARESELFGDYLSRFGDYLS